MFKYLIQTVLRRINYFARRVASFYGKYRCSACGSRVRSYQPLPDFYIQNAQKYGFPYGVHQAETCNSNQYSCPFCSAGDRDRLYALYIKQYLSNLHDKAVNMLDIGPSGSLSRMMRRISVLNRSLSYRTADLLTANVDDRIDIMDMKLYEDNSFDFIICSHVLEHVSDDKKALRELYRILKPGGKAIIMVPIVLGIEEIDEDPSVLDEATRWKRFGQSDHVRLYSRDGFIERVTDAGFLLHQYGKSFFGEAVYSQNGISERSILYIAEK